VTPVATPVTATATAYSVRARSIPSNRIVIARPSDDTSTGTSGAIVTSAASTDSIAWSACSTSR
jgi:hypothetical protein